MKTLQMQYITLLKTAAESSYRVNKIRMLKVPEINKKKSVVSIFKEVTVFEK